jgi:hypothetical protein
MQIVQDRETDVQLSNPLDFLVNNRQPDRDAPTISKMKQNYPTLRLD